MEKSTSTPPSASDPPSPSASGSASNSILGGESSRDSKKVTLNDAAAYLNEVKRVFEEEDSKEKFEEIVDLLIDYKAEKIDRDSLIGKVKELLKCHENLIVGLNKFILSSPSKGSSDMAVSPASPEFEEACRFLMRIKSRFEGSDVFERFLDLICEYKKETKTLTEVYREVAVLFKDQNDIFQEFDRYIPPGTVDRDTVPMPTRKRHTRPDDDGSH